MIRYRQHSLDPPVPVDFKPNAPHTDVPYEVLDRSLVLAKKSASDYQLRQRPDFHQLLVCTNGEGTHIVDFESVNLRRGTLLRIHPGQVQSFVPDQQLDATMLIWPAGTQGGSLEATPWYPGSNAPTNWNLDDELLTRAKRWLEELREEQAKFDGTPARTDLLRTLMHSFLLRLATELPPSEPTPSQLPKPYIDLCIAVEAELYNRPAVSTLATQIGYSTRTLDRACDFAVGKTAKRVLDERIALEVRRLLTHTDRSVASIGLEFGFADASNFSKFVKRHLGELPTSLRSGVKRKAKPEPERGSQSAHQFDS